MSELQMGEFDGFMADLEFIVKGNVVVSARLVLNRDFENELVFAFMLPATLNIKCVLAYGFVLDPDWLHFHEDGTVEFHLSYYDNLNDMGQRFSGRTQTRFLEELLWLSHAGLRISLADSTCREFGQKLNRMLDSFSSMQSSAEISVIDYYGFLF